MTQRRISGNARSRSSLVLSSDDVVQLARAVQVMVSPLDHASVDHWRSAVNRQLKRLVAADSAGFLLPVPEGLMLYSEEHDPVELARYQDYPPPPLVDGTPLWQRMIDARVMTNAREYGENYGLYTNSTYYQEYAGANGAHDTLAMTMPLSGHDARGMACLHFWHANPKGRRFDEREIALLHVLYPAFCAGVSAHLAWGEHRSHLLDTLDMLGQAIMVCDLSGTELHYTNELQLMLLADPQHEELRQQLLLAVTAVRGLLEIPDGTALPAWPGVLVRTSFAVYAVRASLYCHPVNGARAVILVSLERRTPVPRPLAALRDAYSLTPREVDVATLITRGCSNARIARQLGISQHTARRHTERVLLKLKVTSRAEVAMKLFW